MIGMDVVTQLRRAKTQPSFVMLDLVHEGIPLGELTPPMSMSGIVTVQVVDSDRLADLDLRPLHGLRVMAQDHTNHRRRYRQLCKLVAAVDPAMFVMTESSADRFAWHRRWGGSESRTESMSI